MINFELILGKVIIEIMINTQIFLLIFINRGKKS